MTLEKIGVIAKQRKPTHGATSSLHAHNTTLRHTFYLWQSWTVEANVCKHGIPDNLRSVDDTGDKESPSFTTLFNASKWFKDQAFVNLRIAALAGNDASRERLDTAMGKSMLWRLACVICGFASPAAHGYSRILRQKNCFHDNLVMRALLQPTSCWTFLM